jgi:hypothetical protein
MKESIKKELTQHVLDLINDGVINDGNIDDAHFHAFNEDYYIIGYYNAKKWLDRHGLCAFDAIAEVIEGERNLFGEVNLTHEDMNADRIVNLLVFYYGHDVIPYSETVQYLKEQLEEEITK